MLALAQDDKLLVERNKAARLILQSTCSSSSWRGFRIFKSSDPDFSIRVYSLGASIGPRDGDFNIYTCFSCHSKLEHCYGLGLKTNCSSFSLIWNLISPAPTSIWAFVVLRKGLPRMWGVFMSSCISSTTKSTGIKKFLIFTGIFSAIPTGQRTD